MLRFSGVITRQHTFINWSTRLTMKRTSNCRSRLTNTPGNTVNCITGLIKNAIILLLQIATI